MPAPMKIAYFKAKGKPGMYVAKIAAGEKIENFRELVNSNAVTRQGLVLFLFEQDDKKFSDFALTGKPDEPFVRNQEYHNEAGDRPIREPEIAPPVNFGGAASTRVAPETKKEARGYWD